VATKNPHGLKKAPSLANRPIRLDSKLVSAHFLLGHAIRGTGNYQEGRAREFERVRWDRSLPTTELPFRGSGRCLRKHF